MQSWWLIYVTYGYDTTEVADRLGMTKHEVNRRYRALKALQQMQEDEEFADYALTAMYPLFHEAVSLPIVRTWLKWNDEQMAFEDEDRLRQFYSLITPSHEQEDDESSETPDGPKITTYSQVRELRSILPNAEATQLLLEPHHSFSEAVAIAKAEELSKTWKTQVTEAISALSSMSVFELETLDEEGLGTIAKVAETAQRLLNTRVKLLGS